MNENSSAVSAVQTVVVVDESPPPSPRRERMGTIQSATFNIWSTMVGGGSLSLPLAFTKAGNGLFGPILLISTAILSEFCFGLLIDTTHFMKYDDPQQSQQQREEQQQQQQQQLPTKRDHRSETSTSEYTLNSEGHDANEIDAEDALIVTQEQQQQQQPQQQQQLEEMTSGEYDGVTIGQYTLESITAAAATIMGTPEQYCSNHHAQHGSRNTATTTTTNSNWAYSISALLVFFMCFFGIIGYCVLLRDMLLPVTKWMQQQVKLWFHYHYHHHDTPFFKNRWSFIATTSTTTNTSSDDTANNESTVTWANNVSMIIVVFLITPLCTLQTLTSLQKFSAFSMCSVLILGLCIVYRSVQCHLGYYHIPDGNSDDGNNNSSITSLSYHDTENGDASSNNHRRGFTWLPHNMKDVLDVLPLYISCYVCHYNIPVVYNDLAHPTPTRVRLWLHITVWGATIFYCIVGIAGSSFALVCGSHHHIVQGNVLLNFDPDDPLLLVGRLCLAVTIALAFPVLTIPARDIIIRYIVSSSSTTASTISTETPNNSLTEPLLLSSSNGSDDEILEDITVRTSNVMPPHESTPNGIHDVSSSSSSWIQRLLISICILWSGTGIASCVSSIDIVWDFLGSSLSIMLSYLVPCGCYILLRRRYDNTVTATTSSALHNNHNEYYDKMIVRPFQSSLKNWLPTISTFCWIILFIFTPMIFISTTNAIYNLVSSK
jgi:amino acid permease